MKRKLKYSLWLRITSLMMSVVFFYVQIAYSALEPASKFWQDRKAAAEKLANETDKNDKVESSLPAKVALPKKDNTIFSQLPALDLNILQRAVPKIEEFAPSGYDYTIVPFGSIKKKPIAKTIKALPNWFQSVPLSYANLEEIYIPPDWKASDLMIVHIRDVHENYEAQKNIAKIIETIVGGDRKQLINPSNPKGTPTIPKYNVVVGLEGASGYLALSSYRSFPDKGIVREISDHFLKESLISGAEYAGLTLDLEKSGQEEPPAQFIGVEDPKLYLEHVQAFKDSISLEKEAKGLVSRLGSEISNLKERIFNSDLRELDSKISQYHQEKIALSDYLKYLTERGIPPYLEMTRHYINALALEETLDYDQIESERRSLTNALTEKISKAELNNLLSASFSYRLGNISYGTFYRYLQELCAAYNISLQNWPEMDKYIRYVLISDKIRGEELFLEIRYLENRRVESLIGTRQEKELVELSRDWMFIEKLTTFKLSPEEWEAYSKRKEEIGKIEQRIEELVAGGTRGLEERNKKFTHFIAARNESSRNQFLQPFERFNEAGIKRNSSLVNNLLKKSNRRTGNNTVPILIAGGFHTSGITELLQSKKIAYAVLSPRIGKVEGSGTDYLEIFRRDKTPLEKLFTGERITLKSPLAIVEQPIGEELYNINFVVEREFSLFAAGKLAKKVLSRVTNITKAQSKEIQETISNWIKNNTGGFHTLKDITINKVDEYRGYDGTVERVLVTLTLHGHKNQYATKVTLELRTKDLGEKRKIKEGTVQIGAEAVVGEDILTIYLPNRSDLREIGSVLSEYIELACSDIVRRLVRNWSDFHDYAKSKIFRLGGETVQSNDPLISKEYGERIRMRKLGSLKYKELDQFKHAIGDIDDISRTNNLYGQPLIGGMTKSQSSDVVFDNQDQTLYWKIREAKNRVMKGQVHAYVGGDEFVPEGDEQDLNQVVRDFENEFKDRYFVVSVKTEKYTPEQINSLKNLNGALIMVRHGDGYNLLFDRGEDRQNRIDVEMITQQVQGIFPEVSDGNIEAIPLSFKISIGAVSAKQVLDYIVDRIEKDQPDWIKNRKSLDEIRLEWLESADGRIKPERLEEFYIWGMRFVNDISKEAKRKGKNQAVIAESAKDLAKKIEKPITRQKIEELQRRLKSEKYRVIPKNIDTLSRAFVEQAFRSILKMFPRKHFFIIKVADYGINSLFNSERAFHNLNEMLNYDLSNEAIGIVFKELAVMLNKKSLLGLAGGRWGLIVSRGPPDNAQIAVNIDIRGPPNSPRKFERIEKFIENLNNALNKHFQSTLQNEDFKKNLLDKVKKAHPELSAAEIEKKINEFRFQVSVPIFYISDDSIKKAFGNDQLKFSINKKFQIMDMMGLVLWLHNEAKAINMDQFKEAVDIKEYKGGKLISFNPNKMGNLEKLFRQAQVLKANEAREVLFGNKPALTVDEKQSLVEESHVDMSEPPQETRPSGDDTKLYSFAPLPILLALLPEPFAQAIAPLLPFLLPAIAVVLVYTGYKLIKPYLPTALSFNQSILKAIKQNSRKSGLPVEFRAELKKLEKETSKELIPKALKLLDHFGVRESIDQNEEWNNLIQIRSAMEFFLGLERGTLEQSELKTVRFMDSNDVFKILEKIRKGWNERKGREKENVSKRFGYLMAWVLESSGASSDTFQKGWDIVQGIQMIMAPDSKGVEPSRLNEQKALAHELWENGSSNKGTFINRLSKASEIGSSKELLFNGEGLSDDGMAMLAQKINDLSQVEGASISIFVLSQKTLKRIEKELIKKHQVDRENLKKVRFGSYGNHRNVVIGKEIGIRELKKDKKIGLNTILEKLNDKRKSAKVVLIETVEVVTEEMIFDHTSIAGIKVILYMVLSQAHLIEISRNLELYQKASELLALQQ